MRSAFNKLGGIWQANRQANTFIGGTTIASKQDFIDECLTPAPTLNDIKNFKVVGNNVSFFINVNYEIKITNVFQNGLKHFIDLQGKCTNPYILQNNPDTLLYFAEVTSINNFALRNNTTSTMAFPKATSIGSTSGDNDVFTGTFGEFFADIATATNNGGSPDGDIQELISNGGSVTYVSASDRVNPNKVTDLASVSVGATYVEISRTLPTHVNNYKYAFYFANGLLVGFGSFENQFIGGLTPNANNKVQIITIDEYFNVSVFSNSFRVNTPALNSLYANTVAYYKLDETQGDAVDAKSNFNSTVSGGVTQGAAGKVGNCYDFGGVDGKLEIGTSIYNEFDNNNYTFSCWINTRDVNKPQVIVSDLLENVPSAFPNRKLFVFIGGSQIRTGFGDNGSNVVIASSTISNNTWYFVQVKYDINGDVELKVNNVSQGTHTFVDAPINENPIQLGLRQDTNDVPFDGLIDEVEFYNGQTTNAEDTDRYNNGNGRTI